MGSSSSKLSGRNFRCFSLGMEVLEGCTSAFCEKRGRMYDNIDTEQQYHKYHGCADEDLKALRSRCKTVQKAYNSCMNANKGEAVKCIDLERRLTECLSERICPEAAQAFKACVLDSFAVDRKQWSTSACDQQVTAMQKCLKKHKLYPFQTQS